MGHSGRSTNLILSCKGRRGFLKAGILSHGTTGVQCHIFCVPYFLVKVSSWGINGQVVMSALGSGCTCPTAFIGHCPRRRFQRIQVLWRVPAMSLPEWLGLRSSRLYWIRRTCWSEVTPSPGNLRAGSHSALPGSGYRLVVSSWGRGHARKGKYVRPMHTRHTQPTFLNGKTIHMAERYTVSVDLASGRLTMWNKALHQEGFLAFVSVLEPRRKELA